MCFLNTAGGWLFFGIAPTTLKILGQEVTDNTRKEIAREIAKLEPLIDLPVEYIDVPNRPDCQVIAIHLDASSYWDVPYTYDDLEKAGVNVGTGALLVIDERTSVLDFLTITQDFFSDESCGQCTPCREGNRHMRMLIEKLRRGEADTSDIEKMKKITRIMPMSSLCGLGEGAQHAMIAAMRVFPEVFDVGGAANE